MVGDRRLSEPPRFVEYEYDYDIEALKKGIVVMNGVSHLRSGRSQLMLQVLW